MAYIIDGNNVMGQTPGWHRDKADARRRLLERVAAFNRVKKTRITVVFDGAPDRAFPDGSAFLGIKVLYAEPGSDADSRICRLVEASKDRRGLTIVTSDRQLGFLVRSSGAAVLRSGEFRKLMDEVESRASSVGDGERTEVEDLNEWFRYFGALPDDDQD
jgi:predicted RNA-binding protein with PIN domain